MCVIASECGARITWQEIEIDVMLWSVPYYGTQLSDTNELDGTTR